MVKNLVIVAIASLSLISCKNAYVDLDYAPVSQSNINSTSTVVLGDLWLVNQNSGSPTKIFTLVTSETSNIDAAGRTLVRNRGSFSATAHSNMEMTFTGVPPINIESASLAVSNSIVFEMEEFQQVGIRNPLLTLNDKDTVDIRLSLTEYANDNFRFIFITDTYSAKTISLTIGGEIPNNASGSISLGGIDLTVNYVNGGASICEGLNNACLISSQVFRLVPSPSDSGSGFRFVLDTEVVSNIYFQNHFANN